MEMPEGFKKYQRFFRFRFYRFSKSKFVTSIENRLRKVKLPGFRGVPLYDVLVFFIRGLKNGELGMRASAFSFNFFLALFPAILFFFTIIPYIPIQGFQDSLFELLKAFIPNQAFEVVESTLFDIIKRPHSGMLSLGFLLALYFSTNGIHSLIDSFNQSHHVKENRSWFHVRLKSILLVLILSTLMILAIALITVGPVVMDWLADKDLIRDSFSYYLIATGKWLVTVALMLFTFSFLYYFAPAKNERFQLISPGSLLTTALTIVSSIGFNYYVNNLSRYNALYGSISTLIVVLIWISFNAYILLFGFELDVSIRNALKNKQERTLHLVD